MLSLVLLVLRTSDSKEIEILVLRHELEILSRSHPRPPLGPADGAHRVAASRIAKVLKAHGLESAPRRSFPTWRQFLRQQAAGIVDCDFFSVDTISLCRLYVLFFIHHGSRRVFLAGITTNPTWAWVSQMARNATADLCDAGIDVEFLLRDRDAKFAPAFDALWQGEGAQGSYEVLSGPPTPARTTCIRRHEVLAGLINAHHAA
ncbi:MAG: hypothetical protein M0Z40_14340 [Actinomycetota bacterium]|nr:hypothetical protein [Actinomycetota bacterium]